jgi:hypothetical protein
MEKAGPGARICHLSNGCRLKIGESQSRPVQAKSKTLSQKNKKNKTNKK